MNPPFTAEQLFGVFQNYNTATWPAPIIILLLFVATVGFMFWRGKRASRIIGLLLGCLWMWVGVVYYVGFFKAVNPPAGILGSLAVFEGVLLVWFLGVRRQAVFAWRGGKTSWIGAAILLYALLIYPLLNGLLGHTYPASPTLGSPAPTTIATFGLLMWGRGRILRWLAVIPFLWSLTALTTIFHVGMLEDIGLLLAGLAGTITVMFRPHPRPAPVQRPVELSEV